MQVQNIKENAEILKQDMLIVDLLNCVLMGISMLRQEKKRVLRQLPALNTEISLRGHAVQ